MILAPSADAMIFEAMKRERPPLVVVCSWCPDASEKTRAAKHEGKTVTHGICPACLARVMTIREE